MLSIFFFPTLFVICHASPFNSTSDELFRISETLTRKVFNPNEIAGITSNDFTVTENYFPATKLTREQALMAPGFYLDPKLAKVNSVCYYQGPKRMLNSPVIEIDVGEFQDHTVSLHAGRERSGNFKVFGFDVSKKNQKTNKTCFEKKNN